jgi:hypothetical protein
MDKLRQTLMNAVLLSILIVIGVITVFVIEIKEKKNRETELSGIILTNGKPGQK